MALNNLLSRKETVQLPDGGVNRGGSIDLFEPNTAVRITTYKDSDLTQPNTNPVILDAAGKASIWFAVDADWDFYPAPSAAVPVPLAYVSEQNINPDSLGAGSASGLVPNGSFEIDTDANDEPDGWTLTDEAGSTNFLDTGNSTDGLQSMRFESTGSGGGNIVTDDFFTVNETDDLSVDFDIFSSVVDVRNIVRVEWYDVSQVTISNTDVYDNASTNPLSFTRQQTSATPPAGARFAKLRMIGCDPSDPTPGATNYDRVNVFYPLVVANTFTNLTVTDAIDPDLLDNGNSINIGAVDPSLNQHIAIGPTIMQSKADATTAAALLLNSLGGNVDLGAQTGTGHPRSFYNTSLRQDFGALSVIDFLNDDADTPASGNAQTGPLMRLKNVNALVLGQWGYDNIIGSPALQLSNLVEGGNIVLQATPTAGSLNSILALNPDAATMEARVATSIVDPNTAGTVSHQLRNNAFSIVMEMVTATGQLRLFNGNASGAINDLILVGTRNGATSIYQNGAETARTITAATGGLQANNTLTGSGFERVLTTSDALVGETQGAVRSSSLVRNATTLVDDPVLSGFPLQPSATYIVECVLIFDGNGNAAAGFQWNWDFNGELADIETLAGRVNSHQQDNSAPTVRSYQFAQLGSKVPFDNLTIDESVYMSFGLITQADYAADTEMDLQWGCGTGVTDCRIQEGSFVKIVRVA